MLEPEKFLNPVLLTINFVQVGQAFLTTILLDELFGRWGLLLGFVLSVFILFVFTEAIPKTWAVLHSERAALVTARPILWLVRFPPLRFLTTALIGMANWLLPGKGLKQGPFVSEREFLGYVEAAAEDEVIEHEERRLIESIIEFGDTVAREVMVPRPDMVTVSAQAKITEALDLAIEHGFSRLPVVGDSVDDVLGIAYAKDLMRAEREGRGFQPVAGLARAARFVPETKPVARLMREMQAEKFHMALLVDEYGGISGLVTLEDCLEELVGEIVDEYDEEDDDVEHLPTGELKVDGGLLHRRAQRAARGGPSRRGLGHRRRLRLRDPRPRPGRRRELRVRRAPLRRRQGRRPPHQQRRGRAGGRRRGQRPGVGRRPRAVSPRR